MTLPISLFVTPSANKDLINKSKETERSPVSIFATRDWLESIRFANSFCVKRRRVLTSFKLLANLSLSSM